MDRELLFRYDNDLIFMTDRYYTSGVNITYSRLIKPESDFYKFFCSKKSDSSKLITHYDYGHKMFTPRKISEKDVEDFDRPYAGWHYVALRVQNFPNFNNTNKYQIEVGLVGEVSGIGQFQEWWHDKLGIMQPKGWEHEIENELVINLTYNRLRSWGLIKGVDIITDSGVKFGNGQNKLSQGATLRLGDFNTLNNSGFSESRVSFKRPKYNPVKDEIDEVFFFYGVTAHQVLSNIFIQGSLLSDDSPHTEHLEEFVITRQWGIMLSNYYTTFYFTVHRISPEVVGGRVHRFLSLNLSFRF
nr:lipid A deacylase LpxR family protein [Fulvivirga imtechensis]